MQQQQDNEDMYGNEVKRRRVNDAGDHLKVWNVISYCLNEEEEDHQEEDHQEEDHQEEDHQEEDHPEEDHPEEEDQEEDHPEAVAQAPAHLVGLIGRNVLIEATDGYIHEGLIVGLFDLNGERAVHIQTNNGDNRIFTASQVYDLKVLHDAVPRRDAEVIVIDDDDEEVQQIMRGIEGIQIDSDSDSDNDNQDNDNQDNDNQDDFPDVPFQPARQQEQRQQEQRQQEQTEEEQDPSCCAICLDATDAARNFVSLDCGHQFHFACIMTNMANGGHNRNNCPMCRGAVLQEYDVQNVEEINRLRMDEMVERASMQNQHLQDELAVTRQHREDLTAEYVRVMSMNMQIGLRHNEEREARDALERRAYICGLNERVAAVVTSAANNDLRRNGTFVHVERQIRELCMSFGMMAYDAQYDELPQQYPYADAMEVD